MYSIILAFRVLEAKIGHPGPIAPPAAEDGSGWRRCGIGWRRLRGCDASGRADFGRPFGNRTGTSRYRHPDGKQAERFRYAAVLPKLLTRADGIRFGSVTAPRFRSRGPSFTARAAPPGSRQPALEMYTPRRGVPLRFHRPGKPPTFHPASESPLPPILTSTKQQASKTTQQHDCTTTKQQNKTAQLEIRRP